MGSGLSLPLRRGASASPVDVRKPAGAGDGGETPSGTRLAGPERERACLMSGDPRGDEQTSSRHLHRVS